MSQNQITNASAAMTAQKKLIARTAGTENYFNGTNFSATRENALALRPGTTAQDFAIMWQNPVEVIESEPPTLAELDARLDASCARLEKLMEPEMRDLTNEKLASYGLRIHRGEFNRYEAASRFVFENGGTAKNGKSHKSYSIRIADGKYVSRKITVPRSSRPGESEAWIHLYGTKVAIVWSLGELATDWQ